MGQDKETGKVISEKRNEPCGNKSKKSQVRGLIS